MKTEDFDTYWNCIKVDYPHKIINNPEHVPNSTSAEPAEIVNPEYKEWLDRMRKIFLELIEDVELKCLEERPVKHRTEKDHHTIIKERYNGSVRDYLLSMGEFKDDKR